MIEIFLVNFAHVGVKQLAVGSNNHRKRHTDEIDAGRFSNRHCVFLTNQYRVVELSRFGILGDVFRKVHGNTDDLETIIATLVLESLKQWDLTSTGRTPGRPEIK